MKEFLKYLVTNIVHKPDEIVISEKTENTGEANDEQAEGKSLVLTLQVADEDMGLVIGKKGQTISALRRLLKLKNLNSSEKYVNVSLDLLENPSKEPDVSRGKVKNEIVDSDTTEKSNQDEDIETNEESSDSPGNESD